MHEHEGPEDRMGHTEPEEQRLDRELARELRQALREPVPLPEGLTDRIVSGVLQTHAGVVPGGTSASAPRTTQERMDWRRAVAAVLLFGVLMGTGSGYLMSRRVRHEQQELARLRFAQAMEITNTTLQDVRRQLRQQLEQAATAASEGSR